MNKLQLPQAKLLYAVSEIYRKRRIDETEKRILKGTPRSTQKRSSPTMSKSTNCSNRTRRKPTSSTASSPSSAPPKSPTTRSPKIRKCWPAWSRKRPPPLGASSCAARRTPTRTSTSTRPTPSRNSSTPRRPNDLTSVITHVSPYPLRCPWEGRGRGYAPKGAAGRCYKSYSF